MEWNGVSSALVLETHVLELAMPKNPALAEYIRKRDFLKSPEPKGEVREKGGTQKLYFCVQKHLASHLHYDFRLEHKGVLLSWAVPKGPSMNPKDKRLAMQVEDHPTGYGDFEGVIPSGYGAGIVMLWDQGYWMAEGNIDAALRKGHLSFAVLGRKLKGLFALQRISKPDEKPQWLLMKKADLYSTNEDVLVSHPLSIKSKHDFVGILKANLPKSWLEKPPVVGGDAGKMLKSIITRAASTKRKTTKRT